MGRGKQGFTLVELLVVLVIMAVLAAAAIPAMMGYVEEAKGAQHLAEGRAIYVAVTAAYTEAYGVYGETPEEVAIDFMPGQTHGAPTDAQSLITKRVYEMCVAGIPPGDKAATAIITGTKTGGVARVDYWTSMPLGETERWHVTIEISPAAKMPPPGRKNSGTAGARRIE